MRKSLQWGVPLAELKQHVAEGHTLAAPYRVGVLTANEGYLIYPRWFAHHPNATARASAYDDTHSGALDSAGLLDTQALSSGEAHLVDDIWMAGHLSRIGVQRWVVPLILDPEGGSSWLNPPSVDVTVHHTLESHMRKDGHTREDANNYALQLFREDFERENLWYTLRQDRAAAARDGYYTPLPVLKPWHSLWLVQVSKWIAQVRIWLLFGRAA